MPESSKDDVTVGRRYALCVGIGTYTQIDNHNLRYAIADASAIAEKLRDPERGDFEVTLLIEPAQTTKHALEEHIYKMLKAPSLKSEDLVVIYLSCHGNIYGKSNTFYLLPSDAEIEADGMPKTPTVFDVHALASYLSEARVRNIILLIDACHSGGAGITLQHLPLDLNPQANLYIIGAARHDQVATQSSKLQHGSFTNCLLRAFEQKPHRSDGWFTISQIHGFIADAMRPLQIQAQSASANPNILFMKNPRYSPQSREFSEQVQTLLTMAQYEPIDTTLPGEAPAGFYVAEVKAGLGTQMCGIFPYYNEVEALTNEESQKIVFFLKEQIEQGNLEQGMLVAKREVGSEVKMLLSSHMLVTTEERVWKQLIDFKKYLRELIKLYEKPSNWSRDVPLAEVYVHLNAEHHQYKYNMTRQRDLEEEVRRWLADPDPKHSSLALLAGYGSGKTTFCRHMAAMLAREYLAANGDGDYTHRIPLWIPLLSFAKAPVDLETFLVGYLKQYCGVDNPDVRALLKMAEAGLIFFMFDGFDEMASRANTITMRQNILLFKQLTELSHNKVLVTSRPEYFMTLDQEQSVFGSFSCLYLQLLNVQQINLYLQKRVPFIEGAKSWQYYRDKIETIHDLSDLTRRPVLLEMIVKTLPTLIAEDKDINRFNLYQCYMEGELERQLEKQRKDLQIDSRQRFAIMERIALEMYQTGKSELTSDQIRELSKEILTVEQRDELEGSLREILASSFLNRAGNKFQFSHQSFLEYLIARCLAQDIAHNNKQMFGKQRISTMIQDFLLEIEVGSGHTDNKDISYNHETLVRWYREGPMERWVSSNAISLLAKLIPHDQFCKLPLKDGFLGGVNLSEANLSGIDFGNPSSNGKMVGGGALYGGFGGLGWGGLIAGPVGAVVGAAIGATIGGGLSGLLFTDNTINLSEANLSKANLSKANLSGADLTRANLSEANLSGADFTRANLSSANLTKAHGLELTKSLKQTDMCGIKGLTREKLKTCQQRGAIIDENATITDASHS